MATCPYPYMTYIVSPLAGLGGGISWWPPAFSLFQRANGGTIQKADFFYFCNSNSPSVSTRVPVHGTCDQQTSPAIASETFWLAAAVAAAADISTIRLISTQTFITD